MKRLNPKLILFYTLLLFLILSCNNGKNKLDQTIQMKIDSNGLKIEKFTEKINTDSLILLNESIEREFSNPKRKGKLTISIVGKNILEGKMIFKVIDSNGNELLNEKYPADYLINEYIFDENSTDKERKNYIKKRITEFFKEDNFSIPALSNEEKFDSDYSNKKIWDDIKSDTTAVGFYYLIGLENGCRIAYSKKDKKVVKYFCCC
jgi:hypothetical protein